MSKDKKTKAPIKEETANQKASKQEKKQTKRFKKPEIKVTLHKPDVSAIKGYSFKSVLRIIKYIVIIIASLALIDLGVQYYNNSYSIAIVNDSRIPRREWRKQLEQYYGKAMASKMINDKIVELEAKKANVEVTDEDIETELERIRESMGGEEALQNTLAANNFTLDQLKDQLKTDILLRKILEPSLQYTDDDIKNFFNQYSDVLFPNDAAALEEGEKLDFEKYKDQTTDWYKRQIVDSSSQDWLTQKQGEYNIIDNASNPPKYGFLTTTINLVNEFIDNIKK
ncbi:MAG TPA: SurA N-terminal domain-containing protein [Candidatus Dojkabacteria bacterium]|nr:SurA N-terminal domain-containing protein [Candidatus Dojkabacteria bacterium]